MDCFIGIPIVYNEYAISKRIAEEGYGVKKDSWIDALVTLWVNLHYANATLKSGSMGHPLLISAFTEEKRL